MWTAGRYSAAQNEQWWVAAKSVSGWGCGGTSDNIGARWRNEGQGTVAVAGLPLAAKLVQAARM